MGEGGSKLIKDTNGIRMRRWWIKDGKTSNSKTVRIQNKRKMELAKRKISGKSRGGRRNSVREREKKRGNGWTTREK